METELRIGQCRDALAQLHTKLTAQARLLKYKYVHVRNQVPNTRSRNLLNRVNMKIVAIVAKYRHVFTMLTLGARGGVLGQYITNTSQGNGQSTEPIPTQHTPRSFRIFQANFPAIFPAQEMVSTFTVFQIM